MDVLVEFGFKVHRGFVTERAVEPRSVVKDFDPLEDGRARLGARGKATTMDQFAFHGAPKAFHHGVVVTVAASAHAGNHSGLCQPRPISGAGVLNAAVGMMHQSCWRSAGLASDLWTTKM